VLVEQVDACFQLMEIRAALGKHFVGFNTSGWNYINSVSDALAWDRPRSSSSVCSRRSTRSCSGPTPTTSATTRRPRRGPIAKAIVKAYVTEPVKTPWYIDLLNTALEVIDLEVAEQRIRDYLDAFGRDGTRITRNLAFDSPTTRKDPHDA